MKVIIIKCIGDGSYFFDENMYKDKYSYKDDCEVVGRLQEENSVGYHRCVKSALYDDLSEYVDALQDEENLPNDKLFIVTYYKAEDAFTLIHCVDFGISKQQVIDNVHAQKYVEGANYFTMDSLERID